MVKLKEEYLALFIEEVQEIIDRLEQCMLSYKDSMEDIEFNQSVKRDFHTLKGDFLTYNFKKYSEYFHKVEDYWEDKTLRHVTSENLLNNMNEIREFLVIIQSEGLDEAKDFEEKSKIFNFFENGKDNVTYDEIDNSDIEDEKKLDNKEDEENLTYTFHLTLHEDTNLKLEEIEQFFKLYGSIQYIKNLGDNIFKTVISTNLFDTLESNLKQLIGKENFQYTLGAEIVEDHHEQKQLSNNMAEIQELKAIKVSTTSLDFLLNSIGELITKHSNLNLFKNDLTERKRNSYEELLYKIDKLTKDIQQGIFDMRLIPSNYLFSQFRRIIRDISKELNKEVEFIVVGEDIKLDKEIIDKLSAPLKHMLKNSLDHGIEEKKERLKKGKKEKALLRLELYQKGEDVVLEVYDDGRGLDQKKILKKAIEKGIASPNKSYTENEIFNFIFKSGFSTSDYVSEISGRGVGMNVVKSNIDDLNGQIEIESKRDTYTLFRITLPTTLSVIDGFLIKREEEMFVIPVASVREILDSEHEKVKIGETSVNYKDEDFKIIFKKENYQSNIYFLIESLQKKFALPFEEVLNRRQFIVKKLNIKGSSVEKYLGATILASGETVLVINPRKLV